ncbi:MAG: tetratricopeptide repeat protein [Planctomycetota bacterium]
MDTPREPGDDFDFGPPEVMFLPLAVRAGEWGDRDARLHARRIPDFVHVVLNEGGAGPTAMLEMQSMPEDGVAGWVELDEPPGREEAFAMVPAELGVRAIVTGEIAPTDGGGLRVEFVVHRDDDEDDAAAVTTTFRGVLPAEDPVPALLRLARHRARFRALGWREPPSGLLTRNAAAFAAVLRGLDGEKLLSGALEIAAPDDRASLVQPFAEALALDPGFGLALRLLNAATAQALQASRLTDEAARRVFDQCFASGPGDSDGCVAVAELLADLGDDARALAWLEHAARLDPPSPRGLEHLGLLLARRGERDAARDLWQKGLAIDGHPDFFSHLAQLAFAEGRTADAWEFTLHGVRRLRERTVRAAEWDDPWRGGGVLLECLHAKLGRADAPPELAAALTNLRGLLLSEDRVTLGLCLLACGDAAAARAEIVAAIDHVDDLDVRDQGVRALLQIDVPDFELRFARASERASHGRRPAAALAELRAWAQAQPEFWPAFYYAARALARLRRADESLESLRRALDVAPGQPDVLAAMAEAFDRRRNPKRALELVDEALKQRPRDAQLHGARIHYLQRLARKSEARASLRKARELGVDSAELRRLARRLGGE